LIGDDNKTCISCFQSQKVSSSLFTPWSLFRHVSIYLRVAFNAFLLLADSVLLTIKSTHQKSSSRFFNFNPKNLIHLPPLSYLFGPDIDNFSATEGLVSSFSFEYFSVMRSVFSRRLAILLHSSSPA
jgi:hypothetical protein